MDRLIVPIERLSHGTDLELPRYATPQSAGVDLRAAVPSDDPVTLAPGERALVPTGVRIALGTGYEGQVRPRSGLAVRHGVTVLNSPGTIDADYRGEIKVILINHGDTPFTVERGERIAQLVIAAHTQVSWKQQPVADATERGAGGFGSTGQG